MVPPFDGPEIVRLHNLGFADAVARLLAGAKRCERSRERDRFFLLAGTLLGGDARRRAGHLHRRLVELARRSSLRLVPIDDVGTVDGALIAGLLVGGWEVPHQTTVYRALVEARPTFVHRRPALQFRVSETLGDEHANERRDPAQHESRAGVGGPEDTNC